METLKKIGAAIAGIGILALALYLAAFVFVILLIVGGIFGIYVYFKSAPMRKEMAKRQAEYARQQAQQGTGEGGTIEADYVVVDEHSLDGKPHERR